MSTHRVLVTGGAGYIGSHTAKLLSGKCIEPVVYDNLATVIATSVRWGPFVRGDILDTARFTQPFCAICTGRSYPLRCVCLCGRISRKSGEILPEQRRWDACHFFEACRAAEVDQVIFSSSCATYGVPNSLPIKEATPQEPINPYGRTKLIAEQCYAILQPAYGCATSLCAISTPAAPIPTASLVNGTIRKPI